MSDSEQFKDKISLDFSKHPRLSEYNRLVYPVISRRSGGLSLGVNINPTKKCSFRCVYCQVDRTRKIKGLEVCISQIIDELKYWLDELRQEGNALNGYSLTDIAIAGDGEPTIVHILPELIECIIQLKREYGLKECKIVLFTNGTRAGRADIQEVLPQFFDNNGEIWFKLDFWDSTSLKRINGSSVSSDKIIENIVILGKQHPIIFQSCFFSWDGEVFNEMVYNDYVKLVQGLLKQGVKIKLIQAYTLARKPADNRAQAWSDIEMDRLSDYLSTNLSVEIETYYQTGKEN